MGIIEVENLSKVFEIPSASRTTVREHFMGFFRRRTFERLQVLDGITFEIKQGQTFGIMGRNGSGKSTLLKLLCGIYSPDGGRLVVRGGITPILELGAGWNPELDAIDNILLIGTVMGLTLRDARASVDEILAFAGLERFANLELKHYSSGMAARLAYSVAFKAVREVLILDEVFAVGDLGFRERCEARYLELSKAGHTIVLVSHSVDQLVHCGRAILIDGGRVVVDGGPEDVTAAYVALLSAAAPQPTPQTAA